MWRWRVSFPLAFASAKVIGCNYVTGKWFKSGLKPFLAKMLPCQFCNSPAHMLSNTGHMSLVMFEQSDLNNLGVLKYSERLLDLKNLEEHGIGVGVEMVKAGLYCIAGDNLWSHRIGEFIEY